MGYPLLKNITGSLEHLMGDTSAVLGHLPGAQSGKPLPWYQGLEKATMMRQARMSILDNIVEAGEFLERLT